MRDWIYKEAKIWFTKHKYFNLQIGWEKDFGQYFSFNFSWTRKRDHAGFNLDFSLFFFYFIFYTYDHRHWCERCSNYVKEECYNADGQVEHKIKQEESD